MHGMDLRLGQNSHEYARREDEDRVIIADKKLTLGLDNQEFFTDKNKRMPAILPLQQALYYMVLESTTLCELWSFLHSLSRRSGTTGTECSGKKLRPAATNKFLSPIKAY